MCAAVAKAECTAVELESRHGSRLSHRREFLLKFGDTGFDLREIRGVNALLGLGATQDVSLLYHEELAEPRWSVAARHAESSENNQLRLTFLGRHVGPDVLGRHELSVFI
eukprot:scaffold497852_cov13-Prasinocladus_malaysianus.AAC.1